MAPGDDDVVSPRKEPGRQRQEAFVGDVVEFSFSRGGQSHLHHVQHVVVAGFGGQIGRHAGVLFGGGIVVVVKVPVVVGHDFEEVGDAAEFRHYVVHPFG